jgi:hypothetical protein
MSSIGLGFLVNYVHDIKKDRLKIIDNIKTVLQNDHLLKSESKYISFRAEDSLRIDFLEKKIKDYNQFLEYKLGNLSITDIRAFQSIYG